MTEKDISWMTNTELSMDLVKASEHLEKALSEFDVSEEAKDKGMFYVYLMKEASKRLNIPPHITFNDEAFDI